MHLKKRAGKYSPPLPPPIPSLPIKKYTIRATAPNIKTKRYDTSSTTGKTKQEEEEAKNPEA